MHNEGTNRVSPKSLQKKFSEVTCIDLISYIHEDQLIQQARKEEIYKGDTLIHIP